MAGIGVWLRRLLGGKKATDRLPGGEEAPPPGPSVPQAAARGPESIAEGHNDFAVAMYGEWRQRPGNLFFSPFSVRAALGMALAGAKGETAAQMSEVLRCADETLHVALANLLQRLNASGGGKYEMAVANSLWGQDGAPLDAGFLDVMTRYYGGGIHLADFRRDAERARVRINQWVDEHTSQKIRGVIPPGGVGADTRLVLVNAVYFKGLWVLQFGRAATRHEPFYLEDGGTVQAPLMHRRQFVPWWGSRAAGCQAVDLAYQGGDLSMLVLLPDRKEGLRQLEESLSARMLDEWVARMVPCEVDLVLPRFKITWGTVDLRGALTALGMSLPFDRSHANFSGINGHQPPHEEALFFSSVFHKALVEVNEEGTKAAAATAPVLTIGGHMVFRADHPFLFAIRDRTSGAILFLGRVADPTRESWSAIKMRRLAGR